MADPTNYDQFNERVSELVQVVQDALKAAYGLENISHGQALGLLAGIDDLASAPVGDAAALLIALGLDQYGLNGDSTPVDDCNQVVYPGFFRTHDGLNTPLGQRPGSGDAFTFFNVRGANGNQQVQVGAYTAQGDGGATGSSIYFRKKWQGGFGTGWFSILHEGKYTVDSNGFIKEASPIFRLANQAATSEGGGFTDAGAGMANTEAQGVTAEHVETGVYEVSGSLGLAADGWQIELPQEPGTGQHMIMAQTSWDAEAGVLTVRTFNRQFDVNTASIVPGDPVDIPDGRWLDLRLEMPEPETPEEETTP